jgi:hypothetical protein
LVDTSPLLKQGGFCHVAPLAVGDGLSEDRFVRP